MALQGNLDYPAICTNPNGCALLRPGRTRPGQSSRLAVLPRGTRVRVRFHSRALGQETTLVEVSLPGTPFALTGWVPTRDLRNVSPRAQVGASPAVTHARIGQGPFNFMQRPYFPGPFLG